MIGKLNEQESWTLLQLKDAEGGSKVSCACPEEKGEITVLPKDVKRTLTFDRNRFRFNYRMEVDASIVEKTCTIDLSLERNSEAVEREIKQLYEREAREVVAKLQRENVDALALGSYVRAFHPDVWDRLNWADAFPRADIRVNYDVEIKGRGALYQ